MKRSVLRNIAKNNMKKEGLTKFCKHSHTVMFDITGKKNGVSLTPSYFSIHWREYVKGF